MTTAKQKGLKRATKYAKGGHEHSIPSICHQRKRNGWNVQISPSFPPTSNGVVERTDLPIPTCSKHSPPWIIMRIVQELRRHSLNCGSIKLILFVTINETAMMENERHTRERDTDRVSKTDRWKNVNNFANIKSSWIHFETFAAYCSKHLSSSSWGWRWLQFYFMHTYIFIDMYVYLDWNLWQERPKFDKCKYRNVFIRALCAVRLALRRVRPRSRGRCRHQCSTLPNRYCEIANAFAGEQFFEYVQIKHVVLAYV